MLRQGDTYSGEGQSSSSREMSKLISLGLRRGVLKGQFPSSEQVLRIVEVELAWRNANGVVNCGVSINQPSPLIKIIETGRVQVSIARLLS